MQRHRNDFKTAKLPIEDVLPEILSSLKSLRNLVLEAPPGAGKTTRVPPALLNVFKGEVLVLEPRRLAARMAARRVAEELGEELGGTVGYQVRFEQVGGPRTRLKFLTEGVLTRRLLSDPTLRGVDVVVLDEFHERHLEGDLALALLRRLQMGERPDLRIVVMSATLDAAPIAEYLESAVVRSEGRLFPVDVRFSHYSADPLEQQVASAVGRVLEEGIGGDILVFLPGAAEIRRAMQACLPVASRHGLEVLPLYGDLSPEEQDRAVRPSTKRKIILSTNVAESSITIEGVSVVIDSGLARIAEDDANGIPNLVVSRISKASATQRAGRAGRTKAGVAIRLYTAEDFVRRREAEVPDILRRELSQMLLQLRVLGVDRVPWFQEPPAAALARAEELLTRLGAEQDAAAMAALPVHPRLARLILDGVRNGAGDAACVVAGVISAGERLEHVDLMRALDVEHSPHTERTIRQIAKAAGVRPARQENEQGLRKALLRAFPDRVARRWSERNVRLAVGGSAVLAEPFRPTLMVAVDLEDRRESEPLVRSAVEVEADWVLELCPAEFFRDLEELRWDPVAEKVVLVSSLLYGDVELTQSTSGSVDPEESGAMLAREAMRAGVERIVDVDELLTLRARIGFASQHGTVERLEDDRIEAALRELGYGLKSFAELRKAVADGEFTRAVLRQFPKAQQRELEEVAPETYRLGSRNVRLKYAEGQAPALASRLQDFFGMVETPRVARGTVPLVLHLLAPNQRPVQTTTDLAGFWQRLYPQVRKELSRRYPRHAWPEKPN